LAILMSMTNPSPEAVTACLQRFGLERDRMRAMLAHSAGITSTDLDALEHLEADGPLTQRELGERLSLTSGAITMLADRLGNMGLVRRVPHPTDRRFTLLELSSAAVDQTPAGLASYHSRMKVLAAQIPPDLRAVVCSFLVAASETARKAAEELSA